MKRAIIFVLDGLGVGALPDAAQYGDAGADTFGHIADGCPNLLIPNLRNLGFGNIDGAAGGRFAVETPEGSFGKLAERSAGKDTLTGHWEIAGIYNEMPFQTYSKGFPKEFIAVLEAKIGRKVLGNYAASGTEIIRVLGEEHERTGKPIVYTSGDSVFQIAANTQVIPLEELYDICQTARTLLTGEWACGRVIARPYVLQDGVRTRTGARKDYAVSPPAPTLLDHVKKAGQSCVAIGKIDQIFSHRGVTAAIHTVDNADGVEKTLDAMAEDFGGLIFTNLVDFDMQYGHRRDVKGYGSALEAFDAKLPDLRRTMGKEDILILCADHGNDPIHAGWDHTREYIPLVICGHNIKRGVDLGIRSSFADIGATVAAYLGVESTGIGESFLQEILR